jgi:hypothetical protein
MGKDEETERVSKRLKENHALAWLNVRYWVFVFLFDVGRWAFDVYLSKQLSAYGALPQYSIIPYARKKQEP